MQHFKNLFGNKVCAVIGMVHVRALPGTPNYDGNFARTIELAVHEAQIYQRAGVDGIMIENMHDVPYLPEKQLGPEIVACMTRTATEVNRSLCGKTPCGIQILACGNRQAVAVAKATGCKFIRAEAFVFAHVADEGFADANAGQLLRYRKSIDAEDVRVFCDIKKKHSSHSITGDVSLLETARAAEFFIADGLIVTGNATGDPASPDDIRQLSEGVSQTPLLVGSGVTEGNLADYYGRAHGLIVGSYFKENGHWSGDLSERRTTMFMERMKELDLSGKQ